VLRILQIKILWFKSFEFYRNQNLALTKFVRIKISRFPGFKVSRLLGIKVLKFLGIKVSGFRDKIPGFQVAGS
jgi:hypothetical protein